jgi:hypothetical protein
LAAAWFAPVAATSTTAWYGFVPPPEIVNVPLVTDHPVGSGSQGNCDTDNDADSDVSPELPHSAVIEPDRPVADDTPGNKTLPALIVRPVAVTDPDSCEKPIPLTVTLPPVNATAAPDAEHPEPDTVTVPKSSDNESMDTGATVPLAASWNNEQKLSVDDALGATRTAELPEACCPPRGTIRSKPVRTVVTRWG